VSIVTCAHDFVIAFPQDEDKASCLMIDGRWHIQWSGLLSAVALHPTKDVVVCGIDGSTTGQSHAIKMYEQQGKSSPSYSNMRSTLCHPCIAEVEIASPIKKITFLGNNTCVALTKEGKPLIAAVNNDNGRKSIEVFSQTHTGRPFTDMAVDISRKKALSRVAFQNIAGDLFVCDFALFDKPTLLQRIPNGLKSFCWSI